VLLALYHLFHYHRNLSATALSLWLSSAWIPSNGLGYGWIHHKKVAENLTSARIEVREVWREERWEEWKKRREEWREKWRSSCYATRRCRGRRVSICICCINGISLRCSTFLSNCYACCS
jgi:hypothetical protein